MESFPRFSTEKSYKNALIPKRNMGNYTNELLEWQKSMYNMHNTGERVISYFHMDDCV